MNNDRENLATLAAMLALTLANTGTAASPIQGATQAARDAIALTRLSRQAHTAAVRQCNGEGTWRDGRWHWDDEDEERHERRKEALRDKCQKIAGRYGAKVEVGGDPRGCVLRLHFPDPAIKNGWGDGWCVG